MNTLETFRNDLLRSINQSLDLIRTVNSIISEPGLHVTMTIEQRDFIVEWAFVKVHAAWESFLENCFITYMLGKHTASGFAPVRYVFPPSEQHAFDMVLAGRDYFPWTAPEATRRQAIICFQDGEPFRQILDSTTTELQEINTVRNAVVHKSSKALEKIKSLVRDKLLTVPLDITPAKFLLKAKSGTINRTYFTHYYSKLRVAANKIVPT